MGGALLLIAYKAWEVLEGTSQMFPAGGELSRGEGLAIMAIAGSPVVVAAILLARRHWLFPWFFAAFHAIQVLMYLYGMFTGDYRPGGGIGSASFFLYAYQSQRVRLTFENRPMVSTARFDQNYGCALVVGLCTIIIVFEGTGFILALLRDFTPLELAWYGLIPRVSSSLFAGGLVARDVMKGAPVAEEVAA